MSKKSNYNTFVTKAIIIHSNKYNYSLFTYTNNRIKSIIICKIHGPFKQNATNHLSGKGCPYCAGTAKLTKEDFVVRANKINHYKYEYSKFEYTKITIKSTIICSEHGAFEQTPKEHLKGQGCPKCKIQNIKKALTNNINNVIDNFNKIHNFKYDYSQFIYINTMTKGIIICHNHGPFEQIPNNHLSGNGCPKCARENRKSKIDKLAIKLRNIVSTTIRVMLKSNNSSKKGKSILQYLSYSILELRQHFENLFEPWMNWENWGVYKPNDYLNLHDPSKWKWQIDHIIPRSDLPYSSMEDKNFKKCWALENLRPLRADINHKDGVTRIRHSKNKEVIGGIIEHIPPRTAAVVKQYAAEKNITLTVPGF